MKAGKQFTNRRRKRKEALRRAGAMLLTVIFLLVSYPEYLEYFSEWRAVAAVTGNDVGFIPGLNMDSSFSIPINESLTTLPAASTLPRITGSSLSDIPGVLVTEENQRTKLSINTVEQLILLSAFPASDYQNVDIMITITGGSALWDLTQTATFHGGSYSFCGLGNEDYPFAGSISLTAGSSVELSSDRAIFDCLSTDAVLPKSAFLISRKNTLINEPLFAKSVKAGTNAADWKLVVDEGFSNDFNAVTDYSFAGLFGTVKENAKLTLSVVCRDTNGVHALIRSGANAGFVCQVMESGSDITVSFAMTDGNNVSETPMTYSGDVYAYAGNAGFVVGQMEDTSSLTIASDLTLTTSQILIAKRKDKTTGNAGGLVGCADNAKISCADGVTVSLSNQVKAEQAAGGAIGSYRHADKTIEIKNLNISNPNLTAGVAAGGLFGTLYNDSASDIALSMEDTVLSVTSSFADGTTTANYGGIIGVYGASTTEGALRLERLSVTTSVLVKIANYGGVIGSVKGTNASYVYIDQVSATLSRSAEIQLMGGIVGDVRDQGHFLDIGSVTISGRFEAARYRAGLIARMANGVVRLFGTTDLSATSFQQESKYSGQLMGGRGNTLVYALGSGNDSGWLLKRSTAAQCVDTIAEWGEVLRVSDLSGVLQEDTVKHTITVLPETDGTISSVQDFARIAISMQVGYDKNMGTKAGALIVSTSSETLRAMELTLTEDISLAGTGLNGFLKDSDTLNDNYSVSSEKFFTGKFLSDGKKITLAVGEAYGTRNGSPVSADNDAEGNGTIYYHQFTGLFSKIKENAVFSNFTVDGTFHVRSMYAYNAGELVMTGALAALLEGSSINDRVMVQSVTTNVDFYTAGEKLSVGGLIGGMYSGNTASITFDSCILNSAIEYYNVNPANANYGDTYVLGGAFGRVATTKDFRAEFKDCTIKGSIEVTKNIKNARIGGLIAVLDSDISATNRGEITVDGVTVADIRLAATVNTKGYCGGLLGYEWHNTNVIMKSLQIGDEQSALASPVISYTGSQLKVGALVSTANGVWDVESLTYSAAEISAGTDSELGLMVWRGHALDDSRGALYLYLAEPDIYKINEAGMNFGATTVSVFDELVARSVDNARRKQGVVSISVKDDLGAYRLVMDGVNCNSYQNQISKATLNWMDNPNTRYYYNLNHYTKLASGAVISNAEQLLLWSVYHYSAKNVCSNFAEGTVSNTISTTSADAFDLQGYSYYPIDLYGLDVTIGDVEITFYNREINRSEGVAEGSGNTDSYARGTVSASQHYLMHHGLFRNLESGKDVLSTLSVNGQLVLAGSVGKADNGSGALICESIKGAYAAPDSYFVSFAVSESGSIVLKDLYVENNQGGYAPLLINMISSYASCNIKNVSTQTTNENNAYDRGGMTYAASSLMGKVGSKAASSISLTFTNIALNAQKIADSTAGDLSSYYQTNGTIFSHATLLESFQYAKDSAAIGQYNFKKNTVWNNTTAIHQATYGYEIIATAENVDESGVSRQTEYYYDTEAEGIGFISPVTPEASQAYSEFGNADSYLPYVYKSPATDAALIDSSENYHELRINIVSAALDQGCGTYEDPYIISKVTQFNTMVSIVNGSEVSVKVNVPGEGFCGEEPVHIYTDYVKAEHYTHFREAYYIISQDIELSESFPGIGSDKDMDSGFRGVIIGQNDATITINNSTPFIVCSFGSVVKDLNIVYQNEIKLTETTKNKYAPSGSSKVYFGGVFGQIFGGDNVIDNVRVTLANSVTTSGNYRYLIPVGGYVGVVTGGGVFFRNMTDDHLSYTKNYGDGYLYNNPFVGRVLDGYAVYLSEQGYSSTRSTLHNGNGYIISDITDPLSSEANRDSIQKLSIYANKDDEKDYMYLNVADYCGWSVIHVPDAQSLFVLYLMTSSGMSSMTCSSNKTGTAATGSVNFTNWIKTESNPMRYEENSPFHQGRTHLATYASVGSKDSGNADYLRSQKDTSINDINKIAFLVYYFSEQGKGVSAIEKATMSEPGDVWDTSVVNVPWPARMIQAGWSRYSVILEAENTTYDLPGGFRGFSGLFKSWKYKREDAMYIDGYGFNGNGNTISYHITMNTYKSGSEDNYYLVNGLGFFSMLTYAREADLTNGIGHNAKLLEYLKNEQGQQYRSLSTEGKLELLKTKTKYFGIGNMTITGSVTLRYPNLSNYEPENDSSKWMKAENDRMVGALAGHVTNKNDTIFLHDITIKDFAVSGGKYTGGLLGRSSGNSLNNILVSGITIDGLELDTNGTCVGGLVGSLEKANKECFFEKITVKDGPALFNHEKHNFMGIAGENNSNHGLGALVGYYNSATGVFVRDVDIQSLELSANNYGNRQAIMGGLFGRLNRPLEMNNISLQDVSFESTTTNSIKLGGLIGSTTISGAITGYNIYMNLSDISVTTTKGTLRNLIAETGSGTSVQLVAVTRQGPALQSTDLDSYRNSTYIIFADYNGASVSENPPNKENAAGTESKVPYVDVNPYVTLPGLLLTGDGIAFAGGTGTQALGNLIAAESAGKTGTKYYPQVTGMATDFLNSLNSEDSKVFRMSTFLSEETDCTLAVDLPVLVLNVNDETNLNTLVKQYVSILTGFNQTETPKYTKITPTTYRFDGTNFVRVAPEEQTMGTRKRQDTDADNEALLYVRAGRHDNQKQQITVLDVEFVNPNTVSDQNVFHLYIPVMVSKVLQFTFDANILNGTTYHYSPYENATTHVLESHGTPITALLTYTYLRTAQEWKSAIEGGENLLQNFDKKIWFEGEPKLPGGTKLTLVDPNKNGGKPYYGIIGEDTVSLAVDGAFPLSSIMGSDRPCDLAELLAPYFTGADAVFEMQETEEGSLVKITGSDISKATLMVMEGNEKVYYRPYVVGEEKDGIPRYSVALKKAENTEVHLEEKYYLTMETPKDCVNVINNRITFLALKFDNDSIPTQKVVTDGGTSGTTSPDRFVLGKFFRHELTDLHTLNSNEKMDIANNVLSFDITASIEFFSEEAAETFEAYAQLLPLHQKFIVQLRESGSTSANTYIASQTMVEITYTATSGSQQITCKQILPYVLSESADKLEIEYPEEINDYISKGFSITASVQFTYKEEDNIYLQFPVRKQENDGLYVQGYSMLYFDRGQTEENAGSRNSMTTLTVSDSANRLYYRENIEPAVLKYNAFDVVTGDGSGSDSQLGVNPSDKDSESFQIVASGIYDVSKLTNLDSAKTVRFTLSLYRKGTRTDFSDTKYYAVDITQYVSSISCNDVSVTDNGDGTVSFDMPWVEDYKNTPIEVITKFMVLTGAEFETKSFTEQDAYGNDVNYTGGIYANYKVNLSAELLDADNTMLEGSRSGDYIVYTNARISTQIMDGKSN